MRARGWLGALVLAGCSSKTAPPPRRPHPTLHPTANLEQPARWDASAVDDVVQRAALAEACDAFAMELWARVRPRPGNLALAPASLWIALAMTQAGARGETAVELSRVLHFPAESLAVHVAAGRLLAAWNDPSRTLYTLTLSARLFAQESLPLRQSYLDLLRGAYGGAVEGTDFVRNAEGARVRINAHIADQTEQRIQELLPPGSLTSQTRLVLANTVYFLAQWAVGFPHEGTVPQAFFSEPGRSTLVPTMHVTGAFGYGEVGDVKVLELAYQGNEWSMLIVLPGAKDGIAALEAATDVGALRRWAAAVHPANVLVSVPKFTVNPSGSIALSRELEALGMHRAFADADFSELVEGGRVHVDEVFHKAFVKVDEDGTEAAGASAVAMGRNGGAMPSLFVADHPFLFFVRERAGGQVMFMGRVVQP